MGKKKGMKNKFEEITTIRQLVDSFNHLFETMDNPHECGCGTPIEYAVAAKNQERIMIGGNCLFDTTDFPNEQDEFAGSKAPHRIENIIEAIRDDLKLEIRAIKAVRFVFKKLYKLQSKAYAKRERNSVPDQLNEPTKGVPKKPKKLKK